MIRLFDDKWRIEDDTTCYKLTRKTVSKKDPEKVSYSFVGYFSNIPEALQRIYNEEVRKSVNEKDYTELKSVIAEMYAIQDMTKQMIAKAVIERKEKVNE